jgi:hypothetical protein
MLDKIAHIIEASNLEEVAKAVRNTQEALNLVEVTGRDGDPIPHKTANIKGPVNVNGMDSMIEGTCLTEPPDNALDRKMPAMTKSAKVSGPSIDTEAYLGFIPKL